MRCHVFTLALALLTVLPFCAADEPNRKPQKEDNIMRKKLAAAQKLLGALATKDFPEIQENARLLNDLSKQAAWKLIETPRYESYSDEFQRLTLRLENQAREKNLDGAALSYVDLTLVCFKCHEHVRERKVGLAAPAPRLDGAFGR